MQGLQGRTAVITGAASGLGRGLAVRLAELGVRVVVSDIEEPPLRELERWLLDQGVEALAVVADVTKSAEVEALAARAFGCLGTVDTIFLNAGVTVRGNAWELSELDWRWVYDVNLFGVVNGIRAFIPRLVSQGSGQVVVTSSNSAVASVAAIAPYVSSKHAVVSVAETLQHDLRAAGSAVRVSVVMPSGVRSRISDSFRNRPLEYGEGHVPDQEVSRSRAFLEQYGQDPEVVADQIIKGALEEGRFYVLTDPDDVGMAEVRLAGIRAGLLGDPATPGIRPGD